eukprot:s1626_g6.t1
MFGGRFRGSRTRGRRESGSKPSDAPKSDQLSTTAPGDDGPPSNDDIAVFFDAEVKQYLTAEYYNQLYDGHVPTLVEFPNPGEPGGGEPIPVANEATAPGEEKGEQEGENMDEETKSQDQEGSSSIPRLPHIRLPDGESTG